MVTALRMGVPLVLAAMLTLGAAGCGGQALVPVAGQVIFEEDGEPVRTGRIEFRGEAPNARAVGVLDSEGRFQLRTDEGKAGCQPGEYDIVIVQLVSVEHQSLESHDHGRPLPRKYADYYTSGLQASVPEAGVEDLVLRVSSSAK